MNHNSGFFDPSFPSMSGRFPVRLAVTTTPEAPWRTGLVAITDVSTQEAPAVGSPLRLGGPSAQTILGFGGCFNEIGAAALARLPVAARERVLHLLFAPDAAALDFCRLPIGASDYALSWYTVGGCIGL